MPDFFFFRSEDSSFVAGLRLFFYDTLFAQRARETGFHYFLVFLCYFCRPWLPRCLGLACCIVFFPSITRHSLSERGTLGMIRQILQRAVTPFFFPAFQVSLFTTHLSSFGFFFGGEDSMEWRWLSGRLQRSMVTATSFTDYGSLVVINGITADHGACVSLLGKSGLS